MILHETPSDRQNEARILHNVANYRGVEVAFTSQAYPIDAIFHKGRKTLAFAEARVRNNPREKYPTFLWSLQKYICVSHYSKYLPTFLFVEWEDGLFWVKLTGDSFPIDYINRSFTTGRTKADNEPCVCIPINQFKPLNINAKN